MLLSNGAGHVPAVRPGVADWRQGRKGRTGDRSWARGGTVHTYGPGFSARRERDRPSLHRAAARRAHRFDGPLSRGGSWNGGRPGHHGSKGRGMIEREA